MPKAPVLALLTVMFWLDSRRGFAADSSPLLLVLAECGTAEDEGADAVRDRTLALMRMELAPEALLVLRESEFQRAFHQGALWLRLCGDEASIARFSSRGLEDVREVALSGLMEGARARTLALVLSGLGPLADEALPTPTPMSRPPPPQIQPVPVSTPRAEPGAESWTELEGTLASRSYFSPLTVLYGPRLGVRFGRFALGAVALLGREADHRQAAFVGAAGASLGCTLVRSSRNPSVGIDLLGEIGSTWTTGSAVSEANRARRVALWVTTGLTLTIDHISEGARVLCEADALCDKVELSEAPLQD